MTIDFAAYRADIHARLLPSLEQHVQRLGWGAAEVRAAQRDGLRRLLAHAVEQSPFHGRRLAGIDVERIEPDDLRSLPVMTKGEMMASLDDVFTDRRLTRDLVERALAATGADAVPILDEYVAIASGGSSGERGVFVLDRDAHVAFVSSLSRPLAARLRALGGPPPGGLDIAMVAAATAIHATGLAAPMSVGAAMPFHFHAVPVTLPIDDIVERLNALQAPALYGYPSILHRLAAEKRAGRLTISPLMITTTSETLEPEVRAAISDAFGAPVVNTFGSSEGLVGTSAPDGDEMTFNSDLCIVELVDADGQPVGPGEPSARVLVTNLFNRTQPLIRYEMNDVFVRTGDDGGFLRATVQGRADDVLRYDGCVDVHPGVVRSVLLRSPEIVDYRVLQTRLGVDVEALATAPPDVDAITDRLAAALAAAGLPDATVGVRVVDAFDRHHQTGKLRRFVPLPA